MCFVTYPCIPITLPTSPPPHLISSPFNFTIHKGNLSYMVWGSHWGWFLTREHTLKES